MKAFLASLCVLSAVSGFVSRAPAAALDIATVGAPSINCVFDADCSVSVDDFVSHFSLGATSGDAFLQSRMLPQGQAATPGADLYAYEYRIDLRNLAGLTALPCVHTLSIEFGAIASLDYDGDGDPDDVYVVTKGGIGSVAPTTAETDGNKVIFHFNPSVCAGSHAGGGESTFFFGLASKNPPVAALAEIDDTLGGITACDIRAPQRVIALPASANFLRGDANGSGKMDIADAVAILGHIFLGEAKPNCMKAADVNDDGKVDLSDPISALSFLFLGGAAPAIPFLACGADPTADALTCESYRNCPESRCPDPKVESIQFEIVSRSGDFGGDVRITGTVRNAGSFFDSNPKQQIVQLLEESPGARPLIVARRTFVDLAEGESVTLWFQRGWDASSPGEGEFPPSYRVLISYDPDIFIDGNPANDDCHAENNELSRSGSEINDMFR